MKQIVEHNSATISMVNKDVYNEWTENSIQITRSGYSLQLTACCKLNYYHE